MGNRYKFYLIGLFIVCPLLWVFMYFFSVGNSWGQQYVSDFLINQEIIPPPILNPTLASSKLNSDNIKYKVGKKFMSQSNVTIIGVGRDLEKSLNRFLNRIETLCKEFQYCRTIFVEGESTDNTHHILLAWSAAFPHNRTTISINTKNITETVGPFKGMMLPREGRISTARNVALKVLRSMSTNTEFVMMVDMDIIAWDTYGIYDTFGRIFEKNKQSDGWGLICGHGIILHGLYRDVYALRSPGLNTNHHLGGKDHDLYNISKDQKDLNRKFLKESKKKAVQVVEGKLRYDESGELSVIDKTVRSVNVNDMNQLAYQVEKKMIPLDSCFGGLAIYRSDSIKDCWYNHRYSEPPYIMDCEHVIFNKCVKEKKNGKIYSNPNMKVWYGHTGFDTIDLKKEIYNFIFSS